MDEKFKKIIDILIVNNQSVSSMESCTGGAFASYLTDVPGASNVFRFSAVTYSNEFKIKMGVSSDVIEKYSVYSFETARSMSKSISCYADSTYGIGITGKLNRVDEVNKFGNDNEVFISIYSRVEDKYYDYNFFVDKVSRRDNKKLIVDFICDKFLDILC